GHKEEVFLGLAVSFDGKNISTETTVAIVLLALGFAFWKRREACKAFTTDYFGRHNDVDDITTSGSLQFEFKAIEAATNSGS
ncbi:unnamed protein product, partial [Brassica oleracea]